MAIARPMGRPSSPPFALITVVILLVIAVAAAVGLYVQLNKAEDDIVTKDQLAKKAMADLIQVKSGIGRLTAGISPQSSQLAQDKESAEKVVKEIDDLLKKIKKDPGGQLEVSNTYSDAKALDAIRLLDDNRNNLYKQLGEANKKLLDDASQILTLTQSRDSLVAEVKKIKDEDLAQRTDLTKKHEAELKKATDTTAQATAENSSLSKQLNDLKISSLSEKKELQLVISRLETTIRELTKQLTVRDQSMIETIRWKAAKQPDGQVIQVFPDTKVVYLRLVRPDQTRLGMRYDIFGKGRPVPDTGQGKAVVEVSSLEGNTIQAKIVKETAGDPVTVGDNALNLVTGPTTFNFVVFGDFDLNNDGTVEPTGKSQIEGLITRWGGRIQQDVDITTNFLILGLQPMVPTVKPREGADPLEVATYNRRVEEAKKWTTLHDLALRYTIPVLNCNTFLHWVGYFNNDTAPGWEKRVRPGEDYFPGS